MKKLMFIAGVLISSFSFGSDNLPLRNEITEKLILDLSEIELEEYDEDFVVVSFMISEGEISIKEITGTQKQLVQKVKSKLIQLDIEELYTEDVLYRYKVMFEIQ